MKRKEDEILETINEFDENDVNTSVVAVIKIAMNLIKIMRTQTKGLLIALVVSVLVNIGVVTAFLIYESQFEIVDTTTEEVTTEMDASGENANINAAVGGNQYNDSATHNDGGSVNGEGEGEGYGEENSNQSKEEKS